MHLHILVHDRQDLRDDRASSWADPPPTLASGYGVLGETDLGKRPTAILDEHETKVKKWVQKANPYELKAAVATAVEHTLFGKFRAELWDMTEERKFGTSPEEDILKYDLWLKKMEISETKPHAVFPEPPEKEDGSTEQGTEAYKAYWKKIERKGGASNLSVDSTTPSRSGDSVPSSSPAEPTPSQSASPTGITPDAKRKLVLEGGIGHAYTFLHTIHK